MKFGNMGPFSRPTIKKHAAEIPGDTGRRRPISAIPKIHCPIRIICQLFNRVARMPDKNLPNAIPMLKIHLLNQTIIWLKDVPENSKEKMPR